MKLSALKHFLSPDPESFGGVLKQLGFVSGACYQYCDGNLVLKIQSDSTVQWPAVVESNFNYTSRSGIGLPSGFVKRENAPTNGYSWPKGVNFYFPESAFGEEMLIFALKNASTKRCRPEELNGGLEALATRMLAWMRRDNERVKASDERFEAHVRALGLDLQSVIDHELRTPMAAVSGYLELLQSMESDQRSVSFDEYFAIIRSQTLEALGAMEKLSLALGEGDELLKQTSVIDACDVMRTLCDTMRSRALEFVHASAAKKVEIKLTHVDDLRAEVIGNVAAFRWALWEVLKNSVIHSRHGKVDVSVYCSDNSLVIDFSDDGLGVTPGADELIFLRFYQDPTTESTKRGKRGLGLGLFLARSIAEKHMGKLSLVRTQERRAVFRFLWPLAKKEDLQRGA